MIVIGSESGVAFGALPLARLVASPQAVEAKDVETFGEDGVFSRHFARRARQRVLVLAQLLAQHFVGCARRFDLLQTLDAAFQLRQLLLSVAIIHSLEPFNSFTSIKAARNGLIGWDWPWKTSVAIFKQLWIVEMLWKKEEEEEEAEGKERVKKWRASGQGVFQYPKEIQGDYLEVEELKNNQWHRLTWRRLVL